MAKEDTKKDDPADVARGGVHGMMNKVKAAMGHILPTTASAETRRKMAEPGSGKEH